MSTDAQVLDAVLSCGAHARILTWTSPSHVTMNPGANDPENASVCSELLIVLEWILPTYSRS
jgi:hypothetical protein